MLRSLFSKVSSYVTGYFRGRSWKFWVVFVLLSAICGTIFVYWNFWNWYKVYNVIYLERDESIEKGAFVYDMEWKLEPPDALARFGYSFESMYVYHLPEVPDGFRGWAWTTPPSYVIGMDFTLSRPEDRARLEREPDRWSGPFAMHYGGGTTCYRWFDCDSNGDRSWSIDAFEDPIMFDLQCPPQYLKFIGHPQDTLWFPLNVNDTLFVLHVWRKGLEFSEAKRLAVPNPEQEERNRQKYEAWQKSLTQAQKDSIEAERLQHIKRFPKPVEYRW